MSKAREELKRVIAKISCGSIFEIDRLVQAILDAGFIRLEDAENRLHPYKIMQPVYHEKEKTIVYQEMTEKEKKGIFLMLKTLRRGNETK